MARAYTQDEQDFYDLMNGEHVVLGRWAHAKMMGGLDPRDVATLLRYVADRADGWCIGRYGRSASKPTPDTPCPEVGD